jgi:hypothetical protein
MNELSNKQLMLTLAVMLVLGSAVFILLSQSAKNATFFGQHDKIYNDLNVFSSDKSTPENSYSSQSDFRFPSYKMKNSIASYETSSEVVDFNANTYAASKVQNKTKSTIKSNYQNNTNPIYSYSHNRQGSAINFSSNVRKVLPTTNESHSGNTLKLNFNEIQSIGIFGDKTKSVSNNYNNSFIALNTLSITTELSENNSPMMIGGGSNPGDPAVPVGDGTLILLIMALVFSLKKL